MLKNTHRGRVRCAGWRRRPAASPRRPPPSSAIYVLVIHALAICEKDESRSFFYLDVRRMERRPFFFCYRHVDRSTFHKIESARTLKLGNLRARKCSNASACCYVLLFSCRDAFISMISLVQPPTYSRPHKPQHRPFIQCTAPPIPPTHTNLQHQHPGVNPLRRRQNHTNTTRTPRQLRDAAGQPGPLVRVVQMRDLEADGCICVVVLVVCVCYFVFGGAD